MKFCLSYFLFFWSASFFIVLASPKVAPHLTKVFISTGNHKYQKRLPWAIKDKQHIEWMDKFGYLQRYRKNYFLKGSGSIEELLKFTKELKRRNRQNSNQVKKLIDDGNFEIPQWALRKYR